MGESRWIRTILAEQKTGHAGRRGFITPAAKGDGAKFVGKTYDLTESFFGNTVGELKKLLDAE